MTQTPYKQKNRTGENFRKSHRLKEQAESIHLVSSPEESEPKNLPSIGDRYEVLGLIGKGGMGSVYKVFDREQEKIFAIKVMQPELAKDQVAQKRFEQEVEATCQLTHPNLVATYGHGKTIDGTPYLVMDYIPGEALSDLLVTEGPLEPARALRLFQQICDALYHAHKNGVIHRDLKPTNVIISKTEDGTERAKLLDFGIAKILTSANRETHNLTETGTVFGSPQYMSPEHCLGFKMDERSDIYSLGCMVYEMLTGRTPFSDSNAVQVVVKHINEEAMPFPAERKQDKVGKRLESVTLKCLEKEAERRYQSVSEISKDLELISAGKKPSNFIRHKKPRAEFSKQHIAVIVAGATLLISGIWQSSEMMGADYQRLLIHGSILLICASGSVAFLIASIEQCKQLLSGNTANRTWWRAMLAITLTISCWAFMDNAISQVFGWSLGGFLAHKGPDWLLTVVNLLPFINKIAFGFAMIASVGCLIFRSTRKIPVLEFLFQQTVTTVIILILCSIAIPRQASSAISSITGNAVMEKHAPGINENLLKFSLLLDPRNQKSVLSLAEFYVHQGDRGKADRLYENYFLREPLNNELAWAHYKRSLTYVGRENDFERFQELTAAIKLSPRREYYEDRGMMHWERGETREALSDFNNATRCEPGAPGPFCKRALALSSVKDWNSAVMQLNRIASVQATQQHPEVYFLRGLIYEHLGDPEYIKDYQRLIALSSTGDKYENFENADKLVRLVYAYKKVGDEANYQKAMMELVQFDDYQVAQQRLVNLTQRAGLPMQW